MAIEAFGVGGVLEYESKTTAPFSCRCRCSRALPILFMGTQRAIFAYQKQSSRDSLVDYGSSSRITEGLLASRHAHLATLACVDHNTLMHITTLRALRLTCLHELLATWVHLALPLPSTMSALPCPPTFAHVSLINISPFRSCHGLNIPPRNIPKQGLDDCYGIDPFDTSLVRAFACGAVEC